MANKDNSQLSPEEIVSKLQSIYMALLTCLKLYKNVISKFRNLITMDPRDRNDLEKMLRGRTIEILFELHDLVPVFDHVSKDLKIELNKNCISKFDTLFDPFDIDDFRRPIAHVNDRDLWGQPMKMNKYVQWYEAHPESEYWEQLREITANGFMPIIHTLRRELSILFPMNQLAKVQAETALAWTIHDEELAGIRMPIKKGNKSWK